MADKFCRQCGAPLAEGARFCKYCMTPAGEESTDSGCRTEDGGTEPQGTVVGKVNLRKEGHGCGGGFDTGNAARGNRPDGMGGDSENGGAQWNPYKIYGVLAYFSIGVLVPILFKMDVRFVRFHVNQGLVLFLAEALLALVYGFVGGIPLLAMVVSVTRLLCVAFMVLGMVSAVRGSEKPLPLIGKIHLVREGK